MPRVKRGTKRRAKRNPKPPPQAPPRPRIVRVHGHIDLSSDDAGRPLGAEDYCDPQFDLDAYIRAFDPATWGRAPPSGPLEDARQRSAQRQAERVVLRVPSHTTLIGVGSAAADGLLGRTAQAVLPAPGGQGEARRRADGRVGIALHEADAARGQAIEHRRHRAEVGWSSAVAAEVGIAEIVGDDEDDVGPAGAGRVRHGGWSGE